MKKLKIPQLRIKTHSTVTIVAKAKTTPARFDPGVPEMISAGGAGGTSGVLCVMAMRTARCFSQLLRLDDRTNSFLATASTSAVTSDSACHTRLQTQQAMRLSIAAYQSRTFSLSGRPIMSEACVYAPSLGQNGKPKRTRTATGTSGQVLSLSMLA